MCYCFTLFEESVALFLLPQEAQPFYLKVMGLKAVVHGGSIIAANA
jgi:hypothetical protein